jgi:hypothetical protein
LTGALVIVIVVSSWRSNRWDRQRAGLDLILDQRGADMADVPERSTHSPMRMPV